MKVLKFHISDYGPLPDRGIFNLDDFNLFFGENESGKTLTVDGLIKILVGDISNLYNSLDRINYDPEGFVTLQESSTEIKLKDNKKINDIIEITNREFARLFIIRDSDLAFRDKEEFYKNITKTLLGLRLNDIEEVIGNLDDLCNLTPTGMFSDQAPYKLKTKIEDANDAITKIKTLLRELHEENYDRIEEEITQLNYKQEAIKSEINHYMEAKKRELYEDATKAYTKFCKNQELYSQYKNFSQEGKTKWIEQENIVRNTNENLESLSLELEKKNSERNDLKPKIARKKQEIERPKEIKKKLDESIKLNLKSYRKEYLDLKKSLEKEPIYKHIFYISVLIFIASLISGAISSQLIYYILSFLLIFIGVGSIALLYNNYNKKGKLARFLEEQKLLLAKYGISGENYKELIKAIDIFEHNYEQNLEDLRKLKSKDENLMNQIEDLKDKRIPKQSNRIEDAKSKIQSIKENTGVKTIQEYEDFLKKKEEAEQNMNTEGSLLNGMFSIDTNKNHQNVDLWKQKIDELEKFQDKSRDYYYSEHEYEDLNRNLDDLNEKIDDLENKRNNYKDQLRDLEIKVNEIVNMEDDYHKFSIENLKDLEKSVQILENFINKNENEKRYGTIAKEIFNEIANQEREKIITLLSEKSTIIQRFKEITNSRYTNITFDIDSGEISVETDSGEIIPARYLSGGTFDQLFFAVRIGIGELYFKDKTGFFILDDPFIKADYDRVKRLLELLKRIINEGWQIVYFSSKQEINDLLLKDIENGAVKLFEFNELI